MKTTLSKRDGMATCAWRLCRRAWVPWSRVPPSDLALNLNPNLNLPVPSEIKITSRIKIKIPKPAGRQALRVAPVAFARTAGLSLIEIMVAVTLLAVIMVALFAAFNVAERSLRFSASQTDVLVDGRSTMILITRELQELAASQQPGVVNLIAFSPPGPGPVNMPRPSADGIQTNVLQDFFFLTRKNDVWTGVGYFMSVRGEGVGTLYRFTSSATNALGINLGRPYQDYATAAPTNSGRVADGLVHLTLRAFNAQGEPLWPADSTNDVAIWANGPRDQGFAFTNQMLPAYLELELGVVDPKVYRQYRVILGDSATPTVAATSFLENQIGKVYLFRQRIPIRNHHEP